MLFGLRKFWGLNLRNGIHNWLQFRQLSTKLAETSLYNTTYILLQYCLIGFVVAIKVGEEFLKNQRQMRSYKLIGRYLNVTCIWAISAKFSQIQHTNFSPSFSLLKENTWACNILYSACPVFVLEDFTQHLWLYKLDQQSLGPHFKNLGVKIGCLKPMPDTHHKFKPLNIYTTTCHKVY